MNKNNLEKVNKMIIAGPKECNGIGPAGRCLHPMMSSSGDFTV